MPYAIERLAEHVEVRVWGAPTPWEVLAAVDEMHRADPHKCTSDMWILSPESVLPFAAFADLANQVRARCDAGSAGAPSAIVSADGFQRAQLIMYREAARHLPFEIEVFGTREEALAWLRGRWSAPAASPPDGPIA